MSSSSTKKSFSSRPAKKRKIYFDSSSEEDDSVEVISIHEDDEESSSEESSIFHEMWEDEVETEIVSEVDGSREPSKAQGICTQPQMPPPEPPKQQQTPGVPKAVVMYPKSDTPESLCMSSATQPLSRKHPPVAPSSQSPLLPHFSKPAARRSPLVDHTVTLENKEPTETNPTAARVSLSPAKPTTATAADDGDKTKRGSRVTALEAATESTLRLTKQNSRKEPSKANRKEEPPSTTAKRAAEKEPSKSKETKAKKKKTSSTSEGGKQQMKSAPADVSSKSTGSAAAAKATGSTTNSSSKPKEPKKKKQKKDSTAADGSIKSTSSDAKSAASSNSKSADKKSKPKKGDSETVASKSTKSKEKKTGASSKKSTKAPAKASEVVASKPATATSAPKEAQPPKSASTSSLPTTSVVASKPPPPRKKKKSVNDQILLHMFLSGKPYNLKTLAKELNTTEIALKHSMLSLLDKKLVTKKEFQGKKTTKELYWANQDSKVKELKALLVSSEEIKRVNNELRALEQQNATLSKELAVISQELGNEELEKQLNDTEQAVAGLQRQMQETKDRIRNRRQPPPKKTWGPPKSAALLAREKCPRRMKIRINAMRGEWKSRKEKCMDFVDQLADGMEKKVKDVVKLLDLETDEMEGVTMPPKQEID